MGAIGAAASPEPAVVATAVAASNPTSHPNSGVGSRIGSAAGSRNQSHVNSGSNIVSIPLVGSSRSAGSDAEKNQMNASSKTSSGNQ